MNNPNNPEPPSQPLPGSNATGTNEAAFVETLEHRRFIEFCDACRRYAYIGLCHGVSGVGKTLSARRYSRCDQIKPSGAWTAGDSTLAAMDTVFYTTPVINSPNVISLGIAKWRNALLDLARLPLRLEMEEKYAALRRRDEPDIGGKAREAYREAGHEYNQKSRQIRAPTRLVVIDEADRLRTASLEQVRSIFDEGSIGVILIGMPGLEKRIARYSQFYSRIGFVHEFRRLHPDEVARLMEQRWRPPGVELGEQGWDADTVAAIIRTTQGNFRLLSRLLAQIERVLEVNNLTEVSKTVVETARDSMVIGAA